MLTKVYEWILGVSEITFRPVTPDDLGTVISFIKMLAENEGRPEVVTITEEDLAELLFGSGAIGYGYLGVKDGVPISSALLMQKYSSYRGKRVLYIEDLIVSEAARGCGVGSKMMKFLAGEALKMGCDAMEWYALKTDPKALRFYDRLGAGLDTAHAILGFDEKSLKQAAGVMSE
ncbi:MAG: N-acetyltransferase family protein [Kordiimonas sp.]